jgi:hypothetical protein
MRRTIGGLAGAVMLLSAGCTSRPLTPVVPPPIPPGPTTPGVVPAGPKPPNLPAASLEAASRVDTVGRQIVAANPQTGLFSRTTGVAVRFTTIGGDAGVNPNTAEVFHHGTTELYITESLVKQCTTDSQLAAVLCNELGKMVAERELKSGIRNCPTDTGPPPQVQFRDVVGKDISPDQTHQAELYRYEQERKARRPTAPAPDPIFLAQTYLTNAGYPAAELSAVMPLLQAAEANGTLQKQLTAPPAAPIWK